LLPAPVRAGLSYQQQIEHWLSEQGYGSSFRRMQVNIFGDGDASNGVEDSRIDMSSPRWNEPTHRPWNMAAGTVHCDGRNRGSAMILNTSDLGDLEGGVILASSAHVVYDLQLKQRFKQCHFHFMALDSLPGYQSEIDLELSRLGGFDPAQEHETSRFGQDDWAFLYIHKPAPGISLAAGIRLRSYQHTTSLAADPVRFQFIAFNPGSGSISISTDCQVRESTTDDLGGGAWPGQLLDDCDSEGGASGGGLVAHVNGAAFLVGIRSGAHWDGQIFPARDFPQGPPEGSVWDIRSNTNFSRAIDERLLKELQSMIQDLSKAHHHELTD